MIYVRDSEMVWGNSTLRRTFVWWAVVVVCMIIGAGQVESVVKRGGASTTTSEQHSTQEKQTRGAFSLIHQICKDDIHNL